MNKTPYQQHIFSLFKETYPSPTQEDLTTCIYNLSFITGILIYFLKESDVPIDEIHICIKSEEESPNGH